MIELDDTAERLTPMHPAVDLIDGVYYLTVLVRVKDQDRPQEVVLTSAGEMFTHEEWAKVCQERGLYPLADTELASAGVLPRWTNAGVCALLSGELTAPTWAEAYQAIRHEYKARLQMRDERYYTVAALFAMATYFHPLFEYFPILHPMGPPESGKSRLGAAIAAVSFNGIVEGSTTAASVFRKAHWARPTQVMTECDFLASMNSGMDFPRQLQSATGKAEAYVTVSEGGKGTAFRPTTYYAYSPRVLLSTKGFQSHPLNTRCIELHIVKQANADRAALRRSLTDDTVWAPLRDHLYRLALLKWREVNEAQTQLKHKWRSEVEGRTFDKWLPLAAIASLVGESVLVEVKEVAAEDYDDQQADASYHSNALYLKFAAWYMKGHLYDAKDGVLPVTREGLWTAFISGDKQLDYAFTPDWATATGAQVSTAELRNACKGPVALMSKLKELGLVQKEPGNGRLSRYYTMSHRQVFDTVGAYMGTDNVFVEERVA